MSFFSTYFLRSSLTLINICLSLFLFFSVFIQFIYFLQIIFFILSLSLSLYIYIYIYITHTHTHTDFFHTLSLRYPVGIDLARAHKRCTPVDPHIWMCKSGTTSTNLHTATM